MIYYIFGSSLFTALNDGLISAAISLLRTLVCQIAAVLILPLVWGLDGVWWSIVAALVLTGLCVVGCRKRYGYL